MPSLRRSGSTTPAKARPSRAERRAARKARSGQLRLVFKQTRQSDPKLVPYLLAATVGVLAVFVLLGVLVGPLFLWIFLGIMAALLAGMFIFSRRAQSAAFAQVEGQPGAAAAVLQNMRGNWRVTPAVAFNKQQDLVHRVLGRPGVILVAEGRGRTRDLVNAQKRQLGRFLQDVPIYEVYVGDDEGQVPLRRLQIHLTKLPRNIKPARVNEVDAMLKAMPATNMPIPKGPLPQAGKIPRGKIR
jgi:hypothetical protein